MKKCGPYLEPQYVIENNLSGIHIKIEKMKELKPRRFKFFHSLFELVRVIRRLNESSKALFPGQTLRII